MTIQLPTAAIWAARCRRDGEFRIAARHWHGGIRLVVGAQRLSLNIHDGEVVETTVAAAAESAGVIELAGDELVWEKVLAAVPEPFHNDAIANMTMAQGLTRTADPLVFAQYYAAFMRTLELLREEVGAQPEPLPTTATNGTLDAPVGRYIHLDLGGQDYRIYFEEAGQGIPLLLQHTAGCHSSQWRHLFELPEITDRFRLIAYDLPFHGKSLPPVSEDWWQSQYLLKGEFLRSIPVKLAAALSLANPVFMGCSVGGLLALDLAHKHPGLFSSVISVEGALHIEGRFSDLGELHHPQVSNDYKARVMEGLMSPSSPRAYRKETSFVYASGWPQLFVGDLYYYMEEFDLRAQAAEIDTAATAVHILSGEYDYSGRVELGLAAHQAIAGSTWAEMKGVGHFPMSENPAAFRDYLLPILDQIAS